MIELNYGNTVSVLGAVKGAEDAYNEVIDGLGKGLTKWSILPSDDELDEIIAFGEKIRKNFENVVVLGIGGSALGTAAVANALLHLRHNDLPRPKRKAPKLFVEDNIDPKRVLALFDVIDISKTFFIVITKSGETTETIVRFLIAYHKLREVVGDDACRHLAAITTFNKGELYKAAEEKGIKLFYIPEGVGGRFSVFTPVGLVPLACMGIDIKGIIDGAKKASAYCVDPDIKRNPALMMAAINIEAYRKGRNINVLMPYAENLRLMSDFFAQLWGESLGKKKDLSGEIVHVGQTPVKALGVTDQHSQIQLYTEGPDDKIITFIGVKDFGQDVTVPCEDVIDGLDGIKGRTLGEIMNAERNATAYALKKAKRPNMTIELNAVDCRSMGELITVFMYETAYAGALLNVNTYNQPGVEAGKKATFALLSGEMDIEELTASGKYKIVRE